MKFSRLKFIYVYLNRRKNLLKVINKLIGLYQEAGDEENTYNNMVDLFLITAESYKTNNELKQDLIKLLENLIALTAKLNRIRQKQILSEHLDQIKVLQDNLLYQGLVKDDL